MHHVEALYPVCYLEYFIYLPISAVLVNLAVLVWLPYGDLKTIILIQPDGGA